MADGRAGVVGVDVTSHADKVHSHVTGNATILNLHTVAKSVQALVRTSEVVSYGSA